MGRVFAASDWHGCEVALKIFDFLDKDDTLYYLGDSIDRGPIGFKLMNMLLEDPQVTYLKGNHEDMMQVALYDMLERKLSHSQNVSIWIDHNYGWTTWNSMADLSLEEKKKYIEIIQNLPIEVKYESPLGYTIIMEHAGYTPFSIPRRTHDALWDREHFYDNWNDGWGVEDQDPDKTFLVHGHTPVQYLEYVSGYNGKDVAARTKEDMMRKLEWEQGGMARLSYKPQIIRYCDNHKFDIDMCTILSGRVALLDLDTFETIYFDED